MYLIFFYSIVKLNFLRDFIKINKPKNMSSSKTNSRSSKGSDLLRETNFMLSLGSNSLSLVHCCKQRFTI